MSTRQPRGVVRVSSSFDSTGIILPGWTQWTVGNNSFAEADTWHVEFSTSALPDDGFNVQAFAESTETFIEILGGFPSDPTNPDPNELTSFIYGRIDDLEYDPIRETLTLTGRDLTAALIDTKIASEYTNQTSSKIATAIATEHNLSYTITPTSTNAGTYFKQDTMQLNANRSEWDLLSFLAREEGFVTYVSGQTLYFGPDQTGHGSTLNVSYTPSPNLGGSPITNVLEMSFSRSQTVVKGISVTVRSAGRWNATVQKSYPVAPRGITPGKSSPFGATTDYYFNMPAGATPIQVEQRAQALYNQIIQHAMKFKCRMPADETTDVNSSIVVQGTGTAFDQTYFPRLITRTLSIDEGFVMDIEARNNSPNLTPADV